MNALKLFEGLSHTLHHDCGFSGQNLQTDPPRIRGFGEQRQQGEDEEAPPPHSFSIPQQTKLHHPVWESGTFYIDIKAGLGSQSRSRKLLEKKTGAGAGARAAWKKVRSQSR